jgi:glycosyltransferase involved in cell wall biosynthesis
VRVLALLATFNEERFVGGCIEHLVRHGVEVHIIDNSSTDGTLAIAERYLGRGLIGIESFPRHGVYSWRPLLERKEELAASLDADWFMHVDADEIRLPPRSTLSLSQALSEVDTLGYNAVNFLEFAFMPTREAPDHDHADFQNTMRAYYPFLPGTEPNRLNAWKRQPQRVELAWSGGHQVKFTGLNMYPTFFPMRHYLCLSASHAVRKYVERSYDPAEVAAGWHRVRAALRAENIKLPSQHELRHYESDDRLDASNPRRRHYLFTPSADLREGTNAP